MPKRIKQALSSAPGARWKSGSKTPEQVANGGEEAPLIGKFAAAWKM